MHQDLENKLIRYCKSCSVNTVENRGDVCEMCQGTVSDFASGNENPLTTQSAMPGTIDQISEEGDSDEDRELNEEITDVVKKARISYRTDFELVALRHAEFERAIQYCLANGIDLNARLRAYSKTIKSTTDWFWSKPKYRPVILANAYNEKDLYNFGLAWGTIYIGLYEKRAPEEGVEVAANEEGPEEITTENKKLMSAHIKQKCVEFVGTLYKKLKDVAPSRDVGIGFSLGDFSTKLGRPVDLPARPVGQAGPQMSDVGVVSSDTSWRKKHNHLSLSSDAARRRDAKRLLEENLAVTDHSEIVERLNVAAENEAYCPDARRMAKKLGDKVKACNGDGKCGVCKVRNRISDRANVGYPQANNLRLVRAYTLSLLRGQRPFVESLGEVTPESLARHTAYYRHAARVLGFAAENRDGSTSPTKAAYDLAKTDPLSSEEKELFLDQILASPSMRETAWFFQTLDEVPNYVLAEDIMRAASRRPGYDHVNPKTANRRVSTLLQWKLYCVGEVTAEAIPERAEEIIDDLAELHRIESQIQEVANAETDAE